MKQFYVFLMSFALVTQIISNGLFIPMTASAADDVVTEETSDGTQKLEQAQVFIADLFTDDTHIDIKNTVTEAQFATAQDYAQAVTDEETKAMLTQQLALAQAFYKVNALLDGDEAKKNLTADMITEATTAVDAVKDASKVSKASLNEKLAIVQDAQVTKQLEKSDATETDKKEVATTEKAEKKQVLKTKALTTLSGTQSLSPYITDIQLTKGYLTEDPLDTKLGLKVNQEFGVKAEMDFPVAITAGTIFTYDIPEGTYIKEDGSVILTGDIKGTLSWTKKGKIQLEIDRDLPAGTSGGFIFRSWVASSVTETPWILNYETKDDKGVTIPLSIQEAPKPKPIFKKVGTNNGIAYDTKTLTYTIEFSGVEGTEKLADKLPAGVTFKELTSVTRAEYNKFTGKYGEANDDKAAWSKTDTGFDLTREGGIGVDQYKIVYTVSVDDPQGTNLVEANKVALVNNTSNVAEVASNTIDIKHAPAYQKSAIAYESKNQLITWQIVYNLNGKTLDKQTVQDYFSNGFTLKDFKVYKATIKTNDDGSPRAEKAEELTVSKPSQQSVTNKDLCPKAETCQNINFDMPAAPNGETYIIEYTTQADGIVTKGTTYNQAVIADTKLLASKDLVTGLGVKTGINNDIDYINKTATWEIALNTSTTGKINAGAVITDTFETKGMTLKNDSFVVTEDGQASSMEKLGATVQETTAGNGGFTITFSKEIPKNTVIRYQTNFDIIGNTTSYKYIRNSAEISYNGTTGSLDAFSQPVTLEALTDGNKSGVYNPDTKTITWTVNVNYYAKTIANPVLTDKLESNQTYVANSLKVYEASVSKDGKISRGPETTAWKASNYANQKTFTLKGPSSIDKPYQIVYETEIDATTDVHKDTMYKNTAVLTSGDQTLATFEKTPTGLNNGDEFINKDYEKNGNKQYNWTVDINRSQSELNNVVVEDTQTGTLTLDPTSFKLERYDYNNGQKVTEIPVTIATEAPTTVAENTAVLVMTDDRYFKLYLGDVKRAYKLTYTSYYEGEPSGEALTNKAKLYVGESTKAAGGTDGITVETNEVAYVTGLAWLNYKPTLAIHKIAAQTSNGVDVKVEDLADISFKLYDETKTVLLVKGTTDANGDVTFNKPLAPGYYYLVEDTALADYKPFGENYKGTGYETDYTSTKDQALPLTTTIDGKRAIRVEVSADTVNDNKKVALTVKNYLKEPQGCQQTFINKDGDKVLKGSEYKVTDQDGNVIVENIKTNKDGNIVTPTLPTGDYVLVQTKTPDGYDKENEKAENVSFTVKNDDCTTEPIIVENTHACKEFVVTFTNAAEFPAYVDQSTFKLVDEAGNTVTSMDGKEFNNLTFNEEGKVTLSNVPTGKYKLVQVDVPVGYKKIDDIDVSINSTTCKAGLNIDIPTDKLTLVCPDFYISVTGLTKDDRTFTDNATFELVDENGAVVTSDDKPLTGLTIDVYGKIVLDGKVVGSKDLPLDSQSYTLVQTNTVNGYKVLNEKVIASGTDCYAVVTIDKTVCPDYYIQVVDNDSNAITNTDAYETYVEKAIFTLTANDGKTIENVTIGTDGKLSVEGKPLTKADLPAVSYTLTQTNSVDGFYKMKDATVTPQADNCYAVVTIDVAQDALKCTETQFIVDENIPAGVTYVIENADKTTSYTLETVEKDGKIVLQAAEDSMMPKVLPNGDYTVTTTKVPAGYAKAPVETITVTDENGKDCVTPVTVKVIECPDFTVYYEGPSNSEATFKLQKTDGTIVEDNIQVTTDETGKGTLQFSDKHLQAGTYELVQTKVPAGYYSATKQTITVTEDDCAAAITVHNTKIPPVITPPITEDPAPEQPKDQCEHPTINVTPSTGDKPAPGTNVSVTVDGKTTTGQVTEDGKVSFDQEPSFKPGETMTVTVDGYEPTTTTVNDKDCTTTVTITPIEKACDHFTVHVVDEDGQPINTVKVTVAGDTVKTTNGTYTFDKTLELGTAITFTKNNYEEEIVYVTKDNCEVTVTLTKVQPTIEEDEKTPVPSLTPEDPFTPGQEGKTPVPSPTEDIIITPGKDDQKPSFGKTDQTDFDTTMDDEKKSSHKGGKSTEDTSVDTSADAQQKSVAAKGNVVDEPTVEDKVTNKAATPQAKTSTLLPQTGEQVLLYSLLGLLLIGAAFVLFKRARRQA